MERLDHAHAALTTYFVSLTRNAPAVLMVALLSHRRCQPVLSDADALWRQRAVRLLCCRNDDVCARHQHRAGSHSIRDDRAFSGTTTVFSPSF